MHFCLIWFSDWPLFLAFSLAMHCFVLASSLFEAGDMLLSEPLLTTVNWAFVDRNARKGKLPSDHAPLFVDVRAN